MSITLIAFIVIAVLVLGVKVRRGSFFRWSNKKETGSDGRNGDNAIR
jgi:hypothetical protein